MRTNLADFRRLAYYLSPVPIYSYGSFQEDIRYLQMESILLMV